MHDNCNTSPLPFNIQIPPSVLDKTGFDLHPRHPTDVLCCIGYRCRRCRDMTPWRKPHRADHGVQSTLLHPTAYRVVWALLASVPCLGGLSRAFLGSVSVRQSTSCQSEIAQTHGCPHVYTLGLIPISENMNWEIYCLGSAECATGGVMRETFLLRQARP